MPEAIKVIEVFARNYADALRALEDEVVETNAAIALVKRQKRATIAHLAGLAAGRKDRLLDAIRESPELFAKPKTRIFHNVRVGWRKAKGKVEFGDEATVIKLIRRHLADAADTLIKVKERVIKSALSNLTGAELKRVGVTVTATGDEPVVEPVEGELEKLVDALLEDGETAKEEDA